MSLVNKMLRDLDARRAGDAERGTLPSAVTPLPDENPAVPRARVAALAVVAVLAAGGVATYFGYLPEHEVSVAVPEAIKAMVAKPKPVPNPPPQATNIPAEIAAPSPSLPVMPAPATEISAKSSPHAEMGSGLMLRLDTMLERVPAAPKTVKVEPGKKTATKPDTIAPAAAKVAPAPKAVASEPQPAESRIEKQERTATPAETAEAEYRRGQQAQRQGVADQAAGHYRTALAEQAEHVGARKALAALLIEQRRYDEADEVLRRGMAAYAAQPYWPMALARLKVERGDTAGALDILLKHGASADTSAEYQGFAAALLHRQGRTKEAIDRYAAATKLSPNEARWWAGMGIVLDAAGKTAEARAAFERARNLPGLPAELANHIEQRLR
jgi:MSHA biogenesis protein MshN